LEDEKGKEVKLKEGAKVDVVVEADSKETVPKATVRKSDTKRKQS
jgi:predicted DNA-binding antitoxin AbrB/MazE fold protein